MKAIRNRRDVPKFYLINFVKKVWAWIKENPIRLGILIALVLLTFVLIYFLWQRLAGNDSWANWTGFGDYFGPVSQKDDRGKTLWDWLELLIVPSVLAVIALLFNTAQQQRERSISDDQHRQSVLQDYLDKVGELLIGKDTPPKIVADSPGHTYTKIQTTTSLRILDRVRQNIILQFLSDAKLYQFVLMEASLGGCVLIGLDLVNFDLSKSDLTGADLRGTKLSKANLSGANLTGANLSGADLSGANLSGANLSNANLSGACLWKMRMKGPVLSRANLASAEWVEANLKDANLSGAILSDAKVHEEQLQAASSTTGAVLPEFGLQTLLYFLGETGVAPRIR